LIEAKGRCPPEDVGGPWGYAEFLEALGDPQHERHNEFREWVGEEFDPHVLATDIISAEVAALAKLWSRKPVTKKNRLALTKASTGG
jgi:hypothetical protein